MFVVRDRVCEAAQYTAGARTQAHALRLCVQDFEVDSIGGMMAVIVQNARNSEQARGSLGILNWIGDRLLYLAHLRRPNTIEGGSRLCMRSVRCCWAS